MTQMAENRSGPLTAASGGLARESDAAGRCAGFQDRVHDAQAVFRATLDAMARPGQLVTMAPRVAGSPFPPLVADVLFTLCDFETPVFLDPALRDAAAQGSDDPLAAALSFHASAPVVSDASAAHFAVVLPANVHAIGPGFAVGTPDYPDRSATLIVPLKTPAGAAPANGTRPDLAAPRLTGPGIKGERTIASDDLDDGFWAWAATNSALYPLGCDVIFCLAAGVMALPRSTRITPLDRPVGLAASTTMEAR